MTLPRPWLTSEPNAPDVCRLTHPCVTLRTSASPAVKALDLSTETVPANSPMNLNSTDATDRIPSRHIPLVLGEVWRADPSPTPRLGGHPIGPAHAHRRAHRLGQDARRLPERARP